MGAVRGRPDRGGGPRLDTGFRAQLPDLRALAARACRHCEERRLIVIGRDAAEGIGRFYPRSWLTEGKSFYTRACNLPIQGACADAAMLALAAIDRMLFEEGIEGGPVAWVHDEILIEVAKADAERACRPLVKAMTDAFAETFPGAPLNGLVEAKVGTSWAEMKG